MITSLIINSFVESFVDITQNPLSTVLFLIILVLILSITLAIFSPWWKEKMVQASVLEKDERPVSLLIWVVGAVIAVKLIQTVLVQPFVVEGGSMLPTFHDKEFLLVDKFSFLHRAPERGEIAIFKLYENTNDPYGGKYLIKRIMGLPGERVVVINGVTTIYNKENPKGFVLNESFVKYPDLMKNVDVQLTQDQYFVMGDNRAQSYDSRFFGPVDKKYMRGQVLLKILPIKDFSLEPGKYVY